jgi:hypothetical protein
MLTWIVRRLVISSFVFSNVLQICKINAKLTAAVLNAVWVLRKSFVYHRKNVSCNDLKITFFFYSYATRNWHHVYGNEVEIVIMKVLKLPIRIFVILYAFHCLKLNCHVYFFGLSKTRYVERWILKWITYQNFHAFRVFTIRIYRTSRPSGWYSVLERFWAQIPAQIPASLTGFSWFFLVSPADARLVPYLTLGYDRLQPYPVIRY